MENTTQTNYVPVIIALIAGMLIGFFLNTMMADTTVENAMRNIPNNETTGSVSGQVDSELVAGNSNETAFTIKVDSLPSAQQTMLRGAGVDGDNIVITKGMVACVEAEMGAGRVVEIQNGAQVSMTEGVTLISCYNSN